MSFAFNTSAIESNTATWPKAADCSDCMAVSVSNIDSVLFNLPKSKIDEIVLLNVDGIGTHITSTDQWYAKDNKVLLAVLDESKTTGGLNANGHYEKLNVGNLHEFFNAIHISNTTSKALSIARQIMGLKNATAFTKYQNKKMSAYWLQSNDKNNQELYIILKGSNHAIQLSGAFEKAHINRLLSAFNIAR